MHSVWQKKVYEEQTVGGLWYVFFVAFPLSWCWSSIRLQGVIMGGVLLHPLLGRGGVCSAKRVCDTEICIWYPASIPNCSCLWGQCGAWKLLIEVLKFEKAFLSQKHCSSSAVSLVISRVQKRFERRSKPEPFMTCRNFAFRGTLQTLLNPPGPSLWTTVRNLKETWGKLGSVCLQVTWTISGISSFTFAEVACYIYSVGSTLQESCCYFCITRMIKNLNSGQNTCGYNSSCFFFLFSLFLICISGIQKLPNINELTTWKDSQKICLSADSYGHRSEGIHINLSLPPSPQIYSHLMKWLIRKVVLGLPVSVKPFLKFLILKMKQPKCSLFKKPIVMCWSSSYSEVSNNKMVISRPQIMKQFGIDFRLAPELECWSFFFPFCLSSQD